MTLQALFFGIDCVAIFVALAVAAVLLVTQPNTAAGRLGALISINSAGFVIFSRAMFDGWIAEPLRFTPSEPFLLTLQVLMNTTPGAFMLLAFVLFVNPLHRFPRWLLALYALQVGLEDLIPWLFGVTTHPSTVPTMTDSNPWLYLIFETTPAALQASFVGAAMFWIAKDWRGDLVDLSRLLRLVLMTAIAVNFVSYTLLTRLGIAPTDIRLLYVHESYMAFNVLINCSVLLFLFHAAHVRQRPITSTAPSVDPTDDLDFAAFETAMRAQVYHEAGLTIASLAARLGIPEYRLRRLINEKLGYRNFNHMLHAYRIAEASVALADPTQRRLPILTIALSVGYQSINPFNRAFRDLKGTTPSAFRQHALAGALPSLADGGANGAG
ncbi:MAG TPA: helix-turn-helix domain-containing protein [Pseudomonadales bacterium]|nr:helix-turn-helix domain-containing protein [Pseudomonadales bacterium]